MKWGGEKKKIIGLLSQQRGEKQGVQRKKKEGKTAGAKRKTCAFQKQKKTPKRCTQVAKKGGRKNFLRTMKKERRSSTARKRGCQRAWVTKGPYFIVHCPEKYQDINSNDRPSTVLQIWKNTMAKSINPRQTGGGFRTKRWKRGGTISVDLTKERKKSSSFLNACQKAKDCKGPM